MYIFFQDKLGLASTGDNEVKLMMKHAPEWVRTGDPVIRSPAPYLSTTTLIYTESRNEATCSVGLPVSPNM